jgi:flagellar assembly protein FliH
MPWRAPQISGLGQGRPIRTAADFRGEERGVYVEAETAGKAAGLAAAQAEIAARTRDLVSATAALHSALESLSRPLGQVDEQVHEQIVLLAVAVARGLVRRELRADPTQIIGIVRDTVGLLPISARSVRVVLHPEDASIVRERLASPGVELAWTIAEDPVLSRGDCRVCTEFAQIDARLESRLNAAVSALLGDERETPRPEQSS